MKPPAKILSSAFLKDKNRISMHRKNLMLPLPFFPKAAMQTKYIWQVF